MVLYKKILILFILICAIYVLFRLFMRRRILLQSQGVSKVSDAAVKDISGGGAAAAHEGFSGSDTAAVPKDLALTNYFIKSSYNSCFDSNAIINPLSSDILTAVLRKGYRFIDLEVCQVSTETEQIRVCINSNYKDETNQNGSDTFPLKDAIRAIIKNGLTMNDAGAPNYFEPLFIHVRIKHSNLTETSDIRNLYSSINSLLFATTGSGDKTDLGNFVYPINAVGSSGAAGLNNAAKLAQIKLSQVIKSSKKCFIIIDKTNLKSDALKKTDTSSVFNENVIMSGFNVGDIPLYAYDDIRAKDGLYVLSDNTGKYVKEPTIKVSGDTVNKKTFSISIPSGKVEETNFYPYDLVKKYGVQFATMNFAVNDEGLKKYERIFGATKKTGFVTMASVIRGAAKDVRSDVKGDIRRGIYISIGIVSAVSLIYGIYKYGGLDKLLYSAPTSAAKSGGGASRRRN